MPVTGEEEMLGYYLASQGANNEHDFVKPGGGTWDDGEHLLIAPGTYAGLANDPRYEAKKKADEISYAWDRLISEFTKNILDGTAVAVFGDVIDASEAEKGLRSMALEPRLSRRLLGSSLIDAMEEAEQRGEDRFARVVLPGPHSADRTVAYIFLILAYPKIVLKDGYEQYRKVRANILHAYCLHTLHGNRGLKRAVGIGLDASSKVTGRKGGSEDMLALEVNEWTPELEQQARDLTAKFDVMRPDRVVKSQIGTDEYPASAPTSAPPPSQKLNRKQRRALASDQRRAARRRR